MLRTKINVNLGTSRDCVDLDMELDKVNNAVKMGAEAIMDLSSFGDTIFSVHSYNIKPFLSSNFLKSLVIIYNGIIYWNSTDDCWTFSSELSSELLCVPK